MRLAHRPIASARYMSRLLAKSQQGEREREWECRLVDCSSDSRPTNHNWLFGMRAHNSLHVNPGHSNRTVSPSFTSNEVKSAPQYMPEENVLYMTNRPPLEWLTYLGQGLFCFWLCDRLAPALLFQDLSTLPYRQAMPVSVVTVELINMAPNVPMVNATQTAPAIPIRSVVLDGETAFIQLVSKWVQR